MNIEKQIRRTLILSGLKIKLKSGCFDLCVKETQCNEKSVIVLISLMFILFHIAYDSFIRLFVV